MAKRTLLIKLVILFVFLIELYFASETNTFGNGDLLQFAMQELSGDGKGQQLPVELDSGEILKIFLLLVA